MFYFSVFKPADKDQTHFPADWHSRFYVCVSST